MARPLSIPDEARAGAALHAKAFEEAERLKAFGNVVRNFVVVNVGGTNFAVSVPGAANGQYPPAACLASLGLSGYGHDHARHPPSVKSVVRMLKEHGSERELPVSAQRTIEALTAELKTVREGLSTVQAVVATLTEAMNGPLPEDPFEDWMVAHPEEVESHRGMRVAIHPTKGIVAAGARLSEVLKQLEGSEDEGQVIVDVIPP